jgi:hypothetical protein
MNDEHQRPLVDVVRNAFQLSEAAEITEATGQIETAFARALLFVPLDEAPSTARQRKILDRLTPEDLRNGTTIDDSVRVRVGMHLPSGLFDLFTNDRLPDDRLLEQAIKAARQEIGSASRGRPAGTVSLAARQLARELAKIWHEWTNRMPTRAVFVGKDSEYREGGPFHRFIFGVLGAAPTELRKTRKGVLPKVDSFVRLAKAELEAAYASDSDLEHKGFTAEEDWLGKRRST